MTLKIEKTLVDHGTTIKLIGRIRAEHLSELKAQVSASKPKIVLDLGEVSIVDVDAVRFLGSCESDGIQLLHCSPYIREWIVRERETANKKKASEYPMNHQVVLITGALTGIGRATALAFAKDGALVVIAGRRDEAGEKLVTELRSLGAEAEYWRTDVRHEDDVQSLVDKTVSRFGRLDVAVNNAGTEGKPGPLTEQTAESYAATFDTNVLGTLLSMKHELRVMLPERQGSIVNVSSTYGHLGAAGASLYAASKHAVEGLTRSAALEAAEFGVRVNVVAPGPIDTAMLTRFTGTAERKAGLVAGVPLQRMGRPEEIAELIVFVASNKASFSTGATFAADGGKTAR